MHPALAAMLTDTLQHYPYVSQDAYGAPTYGPIQTHPARVEFRIRKVTDQTGHERISRARVFFDAEVELDLRDKIVLPDGTAPPILAAYSLDEEARRVRNHWEVLF